MGPSRRCVCLPFQIIVYYEMASCLHCPPPHIFHSSTSLYPASIVRLLTWPHRCCSISLVHIHLFIFLSCHATTSSSVEAETPLVPVCTPTPPLSPPQVLQTQLDTLRQGQEHIGSSCSFAEQALRLGSAPEVLLVRKHMRERLAALAAQAFPERPHENAQLELVLEVDGLRRSVLNLGALLTTSATAHETVATGEGLRQALVGQPASLTVTTKDKDGRLVRTGSAELRAEITGPDGTRLPVPVVDHKNGTYELVYTARTEGELLLSVLLYGQPVRGSPFRVRALRPGDLPPSPDDVKRRVKSPGGPGSHVRQKAVRRPSSMYSTGGKRKENPIEDELVFRVGTDG